MVAFYVFLSFYLLSKIILIDNFTNIRPESMGILFYTPRYAELNDLILYYPFWAYVSIIGFALFWKDNKGVSGNILNIAFIIICIFFFILSGMAAPLFLLLVTIFVYYFLKSKSKGNIKLVFVLPLFAIAAFGIIYILGSGKFGYFGNITSKIKGILLLIDSGIIFDENIYNSITSNRWTAGIYSVMQFIKNPLFGNGAYLENQAGMLGNIWKYSTASGGHSFVLDTLAFYGISGIPLILILYKFVSDGYKYSKISTINKFVPTISAAVFVAVFVSNILNSSFLFSSFDNALFLCAGYFLGKYYVTKLNFSRMD